MVGNAIKFTASGGVEIRVTVAPRNPDAADGQTVMLKVEIEDTGIGLNPEQQAHLFEPFQQADSTTTREFGGTGLGLSICRRLVELMNGDIGVRSEQGSGSVFWFTIPGLAVEELAGSDKVDLSGLAVMSVVESSGLRRAISSYLAAAGATVRDISADDVETALRDVHRPEIDVVLVHHRISAEWTMDVMKMHDDARPVLLLAPREFGLQRQPDRSLIFHGDIRMPMRRNSLLRAVAAAAGRMHDVRATPTRNDVAELRFAPPGIEEAREAGGLLLIVEDNPTNQSILRRQMTRLGFAFEMQSDGKAGLESWESGRYGMVLTDCHMPRMDGYTLTRVIRQAEAARDGKQRIPIIALTADALTGTAEQCFSAGMDDYLTKPVDLERLDATVRRWLPAAEALRGPPDQAIIPTVTPEPVGVATIDPEVFDLRFVAATFGDVDEDVEALFDLFLNSTKRLIDQLYLELDHSNLEAARRARGQGSRQQHRCARVEHDLVGYRKSARCRRRGHGAGTQPRHRSGLEPGGTRHHLAVSNASGDHPKGGRVQSGPDRRYKVTGSVGDFVLGAGPRMMVGRCRGGAGFDQAHKPIRVQFPQPSGDCRRG